MLEKKVFDFIEEHNMLQSGDSVVAGISGGADSVCLLLVLLEWRKRYDLKLTVVHVHHGMREQADADAQFVERLCAEHGIPCVLQKADVPALAKQWNCGTEEAGRRFRYQIFDQVARERGADRIAVAHNRNDLCETMLFHLFRGSGIRGLSGIPAVRGKVIRPLLCVERHEIEVYLKDRGQIFCVDHTNEEDAYTRNRIRHHILPYVEEQIVSGCVHHMAQTAGILAETEDYLEGQTRAAYYVCVKEEQGEYLVDTSELSLLHPAIRRRLLYELIKGLSPGAKDITMVHVEALLELILREGNREIHLPFGIRAFREYDKVRLIRSGMEYDKGREGHLQTGRLKAAGWKPEFKVFSRAELLSDEEKNPIFPQNEYTKWFDYDKIKKYPVVRTRAAGDYLTIRNAAGDLCHKKLKEYMVNARIPARERDDIPVLAEDSHIIWLVGYRISEYYKVTDRTERILQVEMHRENMQPDQLFQEGCEGSRTEEKDGRAYQSTDFGRGCGCENQGDR